MATVTDADASSNGLLVSEPQHAEECGSRNEDASLGSAGLGCGLPGYSPNGRGGTEKTALPDTPCSSSDGGQPSPTLLAVPDEGMCQAPLLRPLSHGPVVSNNPLPEGSSGALLRQAEHAAKMESASADTQVGGASARLAGLQPAGHESGLARQTSGAETPPERLVAEADQGSSSGPQDVQLRGEGVTQERDTGTSGCGGRHSVVPNGDVSRGGGPAVGSKTAPSEDVPAARRRSASDGAVQENGWARRGRSSHSECNGLDRRVAILSSAGSSSSGSTEGPDSPLAEEVLGPGGVRWSGGGRSVSEVKELAYARLQAELSRAQQELRLRDEEVARLSQIRDQVGAELEELTASLFEEANNMVREANMKQAAADKRLQEATLKVEVLQAEVSALKALVLTSTPSRPNAHLHPQLGRHRHRRSPSNYELATCRPPSPPPSSQLLGGPQGVGGQSTAAASAASSHDLSEADPVCQREFGQWQEGSRAVADRGEPFVARLYREDVLPCLHFPAAQLAAQVLRAIEDNCITVEAVHSANPFPRYWHLQAENGAYSPKNAAFCTVPIRSHFQLALDQATDPHTNTY